jgi:hypothetical protein
MREHGWEPIRIKFNGLEGGGVTERVRGYRRKTNELPYPHISEEFSGKIDTSTPYVIGKVVSRLEMNSRWALARSVRALVAERDALKEKLWDFRCWPRSRHRADEAKPTLMTQLRHRRCSACPKRGPWAYAILHGQVCSRGKAMRRREFITTLSGFAIKWVADSVSARAERLKARVGALMVIAESDPDAQRFVKAIETQLDAAGWHKGRNLEITYRWGASNPQLLPDYAQELVGLSLARCCCGDLAWRPC